MPGEVVDVRHISVGVARAAKTVVPLLVRVDDDQVRTAHRVRPALTTTAPTLPGLPSGKDTVTVLVALTSPAGTSTILQEA